MQGFRHIISIEVRFRDLDALGHVNNGTIITFFETARVRYLFDAGIHSLQAGWNNLSFILAHVDCDFKKPIFYGQRVEVGSRVAEIKRSSLKMKHRVEAEGELAAEGYAVLVYYDYAANRSLTLPPELRAIIETFEGGVNIPA
jgi:acyl-CoA thioester hydrolase